MRNLLAVAVAAVSVLLAGVLQVSAQVTLVFNSTVSKFHPFNAGVFDPWKAAVEKATNGRVIVDVTTASLAPERAQWSAVTSGIADVVIVNNGFERQRLLLPQIGDIPFGTVTGEKASVALWRTYEKFFAPANEYKGVKVLGLFVHGGAQMLASKPVLKIDELQGMKLRVSAGQQADMARALGASPVVSDGPQIFEYVSKGIVDGLFLTFAASKTFSVTKYLKSATVFPGALGNLTWSVVISDRAWKRIPPADQEAIMRVSGEVLSASGGRSWDNDDAAGLKLWKENGNEIHQASPEFQQAVRKSLDFVKTEWLANAKKRGVDGEAALKFFQAQQ